MPRQNTRLRLTALGCVVLAGGLLAPPTATAEPARTRTPLTDAAKSAAARTAPMMRERQGQSNPTPQTDLRAGSFFKSGPGLATLAVFAAGVGYAIYSASNDRIRSTGR